MSWFEIAVLAMLAFIQFYAWASYTTTAKYLAKMEEVNAVRYRCLLDEMINGGEASVTFREHALEGLRNGTFDARYWDDARGTYRGES
jgi:hypothetical protein